MSFPAYGPRQSYSQNAARQVSPSRMGTSFGYVKIEHQAGGIIVESAGERRMFEPGQDLADFLHRLLSKPLDIQVTRRHRDE